MLPISSCLADQTLTETSWFNSWGLIESGYTFWNILVLEPHVSIFYCQVIKTCRGTERLSYFWNQTRRSSDSLLFLHWFPPPSSSPSGVLRSVNYLLIKWLLGRCLVAILRLPLLYCCKCNYKFVHLIITTSTDQFPTCCEITCKPTHGIVLVVYSLPVSLSFSEMGMWRCKGVKRCYIWNAPKFFSMDLFLTLSTNASFMSAYCHQ